MRRRRAGWPRLTSHRGTFSVCAANAGGSAFSKVPKRRSRALPAVAFLGTVLGASFPEVGGRQATLGDAGCHPSPPGELGKLWLPNSTALVRQAEYGATDDQAIRSFGGLAYQDGAVYLFDQLKSEVVVLSQDSLLPIHRFGRRGDGPGEFRGAARPFPMGRYVDYGYLAVGPSGVAVYDGTGIELFDLAGVFKRRYLQGVPSSGVFGFRYVGSSEPDGRILFAVDRAAAGTDPARHLQTWSFDLVDDATRLASHPPRNLWELPLTPPPATQHGFVIPRLQARPLWTVWGRCVIASDGATDNLWVFNLDTGAADSYELPGWPLPPLGENDSGRRFRGLPGSGSAPTARIRWEDLIVDPSGAAWVRQWTSESSDPARVAVVDLRDGSVREIQVPAFPRAFGPGTLFAVEQRSLGHSVIVSYSVG